VVIVSMVGLKLVQKSGDDQRDDQKV
jgi:hypothetical protein